MYEPGWQELTASAAVEFSREGLRQISAVCRIMAVKNPLIKRGLALRQSYVWGQGVEISARDQRVNRVVQEFLDDEGNKRSLFGAVAREQADRSLGTDGNLFIACFTSPRDGNVQIRIVPWDEVSDVITNPEDKSEPWFYRHEAWIDEPTPGGNGVIQRPRLVYYPALGYRPAVKPSQIRDTATGAQARVRWDAPLVHVKVNALTGWKFGIGDAYAAVDWASAYKDFLTDWARLIKSLSRYAWRLTTKGSKQAAAKARIAAAPSKTTSGDSNWAGATALQTPDQMLEAIPKSGATIDSDSGRPLAAMVASALDVPVTMLLGDPGVTGNRATAETLDTPTEMMAEQRRMVWTEAMHAILGHVIASSVRAPEGALRGTVTQAGTREQVKLRGRAEPTIDIVWPDVDEVAPSVLIDAITKADQTSYLPPLVVARLLLQALGVRDVDEILKDLTGPDGVFVAPGVTAGQAAADRFRRGEDPAALAGGDEPGGEQDAETASAQAP
ncbi:hypothetical protein [Actinomadura rudentiformis]|uniref:Phage portal protein n=1 Tax=Actinomadura rudentiformis TaxID=359158 RepID=A0A6H9YT49_9ACTN|nr:hypothetical protein [Actinomadura rudentiformis]KAB2347340.1 hypothetical protein F8566_20220 [Actinomadura rudentiformis]